MNGVTKRKPKPKPRKASGPTLEQRVVDLEVNTQWNVDCIAELRRAMDALEARKDLRDKSHDEPVSNASEAIGQHFRIVGERAPWWRRLIGFMGSP